MRITKNEIQDLIFFIDRKAVLDNFFLKELFYHASATKLTDKIRDIDKNKHNHELYESC